MEDRPERQRRLPVAELVSKSFRMIMVVLYIALGTTIIFRAPLMRNIREEFAIAFGVLMILFGIYRGYSYYRKFFSEKNEKF